MVLPAPFGPRRPNTDPVGHRERQRVEREHATGVAAGEPVGDDRGRRVRGKRASGRRLRRRPARVRRPARGRSTVAEPSTGAAGGGDRRVVRAAPAGHRTRRGCRRRRGAVDPPDEEVQDRADEVDEHDDHGPQALAPAADRPVVLEQVDDGEREEPELHDEQRDDEQQDRRVERGQVHQLGSGGSSRPSRRDGTAPTHASRQPRTTAARDGGAGWPDIPGRVGSNGPAGSPMVAAADAHAGRLRVPGRRPLPPGSLRRPGGAP